MNKREEIREGIATILQGLVRDVEAEDIDGIDAPPHHLRVTEILKFLDSEDVVALDENGFQLAKGSYERLIEE